jgi:hypothetical protein
MGIRVQFKSNPENFYFLFCAIPGTLLYIFILYFSYETYISTIFILGLVFACRVSS